jgi:hypothetical protein
MIKGKRIYNVSIFYNSKDKSMNGYISDPLSKLNSEHRTEQIATGPDVNRFV